ncbi:NmrA family NAD(P)-binding protein [Tessaracoccus sp. HDW20]|nr:NmrA family NAD(P)-binding protein [Tessaracoccus coleopterorum]
MDETIVVAGATGYVGRHVVAALSAAGHRVRVLVRSRERAEAEGPFGHPGSAGASPSGGSSTMPSPRRCWERARVRPASCRRWVSPGRPRARGTSTSWATSHSSMMRSGTAAPHSCTSTSCMPREAPR